MATEKIMDQGNSLIMRDRLPIWKVCGADGQFLADAISNTLGPITEPDMKEGWSTVFTRKGDQLLDKARSPALSGTQKTDLYGKAALYYGIARFPATETQSKQDAYAKQILALTEGGRHFPFVFRRLRIPHGGKEIIVNYYLPRPEGEIIIPEAVLLTGGTDYTKEDLHTVAVQVVSEGMACMVIDMPGTGESEWKLSDGHAVYSRAIKYLAGMGDSDPSRIGMMGISFGGYWSLAAAAACPEIRAAVNCGGPVHRAFSQDNLKHLPAYRKVALARALGYPADELDRSMVAMDSFSLFIRDEIRRISCPLLSIDGSDDPYVPIEDLFMISEESGVRQEEWIYRGDLHCAPRQFSTWMPRAVIWLANQIGGPERMPRPDIAQL